MRDELIEYSKLLQSNPQDKGEIELLKLRSKILTYAKENDDFNLVNLIISMNDKSIDESISMINQYLNGQEVGVLKDNDKPLQKKYKPGEGGFGDIVLISIALIILGLIVLFTRIL